jgi:hypothetical protein
MGNPVNCVRSQPLGSPPWTTDLGLCSCKCLTETKADTVKAQLLNFRRLSASLAWLAAVALVPVPHFLFFFFFFFYLSFLLSWCVCCCCFVFLVLLVDVIH